MNTSIDLPGQNQVAKTMNHFHSLFRYLVTTALLWPGLPSFAAIEITVNSTGDQNLPDTDLTLTEAVLYMSQRQGMPGLTLGPNLSAAESNQVVTVPGNTRRIKFNIAGAGPHFVTAPPEDSTFFVKYGILASDVVLDGYSQPGASPNTIPILASNNAVLKIVIDARSEPGTTVIGEKVRATLFASEPAIDFDRPFGAGH